MPEWSLTVNSYRIGGVGLHHQLLFSDGEGGRWALDGVAFDKETGNVRTMELIGGRSVLQAIVSSNSAGGIQFLGGREPVSETVVASGGNEGDFVRVLSQAMLTAQDINKQKVDYKLLSQNSNTVANTILTMLDAQDDIPIDLESFKDIEGGLSPGRNRIVPGQFFLEDMKQDLDVIMEGFEDKFNDLDPSMIKDNILLWRLRSGMDAPDLSGQFDIAGFAVPNLAGGGHMEPGLRVSTRALRQDVLALS